jgi:hypothetical protein
VWRIFEVCRTRRYSVVTETNEISAWKGSAVMRLVKVLLGAAVILNVAVPQVASSQMRSPLGGTTPSGAMFDHFNGTMTRPVPSVTSPTPPTPAEAWVPDRTVQVPGADGPVSVPGHWDRRMSDHEVYTPPLLGRTPNGDIINFPAGTQPPANERQAP